MAVHPPAADLPVPKIALARGFQNKAVARCCKAWNRAVRLNTRKGLNPVSTRLRANEAYRNAMPPLTNPQNLCDFAACVAHGVIVRAICDKQAAALMGVARVAARALHLTITTRRRQSPDQKNKNTPGCEAVEWNLPL